VARAKKAVRRQWGSGSMVEVGPDGKPKPGSGVWRLRYRNAAGQHRETVHGTEQEARRRLNQLTVESAEAEVRAALGNTTFGDLLSKWLEDGAGHWAPETLRKHTQRVKTHLRPVLGDIRLADLTIGDLDALYGRLTREGKAPGTVRTVHQAVALARDYGTRNGMPTPNVQGKYKLPPKAHPVEHDLPTPDQIRAILTQAEQEDSTLAPAMYILAYVGCRAGEVCALRWSDVDLGGSMLTIARSITQQPGQGRIARGTKTGRVTTVGIGPVTAERLRQHRATCGYTDGYIFSDNGGTNPISPFMLRKFAKQVEQAAGVPMDQPCHGFRHALATNALAAGEDLAAVSKRLTHATPDITLHMYTQATDERSKELAAAIENL